MNSKIALHIFFNNIQGYEEKKYKIKKIHNGFTNISFLLTFENNDKFLVRIGYNNEIVDRKNEAKIIQELNLTEYLYYNPKNGNAIKKWIEGTNLTKKDIDSGFIDRFFQKVTALHNTKTTLVEHDYYCFSKISYQYIEKKYLQLYDKLIKEFIKPDDFVTSHNDLNCGNIIINKDLIYFIDYEWARLNHPLWDFCNFIREAKPNKTIIAKFLQKLNLSVENFNKFMFICVCFALQWTYATKPTPKIITYRKKTITQLEYYYQLILNK